MLRITRGDPLYAQQRALREEVLLRPLGLDMARFEAEFPGFESRLVHFVAVVDHPTGRRVVGCGSVLPDHPSPGAGRLMQMAVDPQRQGEGIGRQLVVAIESHAFGDLGLGELTCHAQEHAVPFYEKLGWRAEGAPIVEAGIPHRRMVFAPDVVGREEC